MSLRRDDLAVQPAAVGGQDQPALGILDAAVERLDGEAAVDHRVDRPDLRAREHGDDDFRDPSHVDGDPVALARAHALQHVGELADLAVERVVREGPEIAWLAFPDQRELVAAPRLLVAIEGVVDDVGARADEPLEERRAGVVEDLLPRRMPGQLARPILPERQVVGVGLGPERVPVGHVGGGDEIGRREIDFAFGKGPVVGHGNSWDGGEAVSLPRRGRRAARRAPRGIARG